MELKTEDDDPFSRWQVTRHAGHSRNGLSHRQSLEACMAELRHIEPRPKLERCWRAMLEADARQGSKPDVLRVSPVARAVLVGAVAERARRLTREASTPPQAAAITHLFGMEVRESACLPDNWLLLIRDSVNERGEPEPRLALVIIEPEKPLTLKELADLGWFVEDA
ncbi:MAG TPA: hypothetical protein VFY89_08915 [Ktedonobacterales bacterium]